MIPHQTGVIILPAQTNLSGKSSQNYHKIFASTLNLRPKWVPFNDPWEIYTWSYEMYRNVTSRHLNLFGFYSPNSSPGNSQLHNPCLGICSNAILHGVVMDLHSARCSGYFRRPIENGHPFLFPKIVPGLFPESKNSHLKPAIFSHPISFGFLLVRKDQGVNTPAAWGLYSSNRAARCTTWRLSLPGKAGWTRIWGAMGISCWRKMGGNFPAIAMWIWPFSGF